MINFLFLCDGKNCIDKPGWKAYGCQECKRTTNLEHAKHPEIVKMAEDINRHFEPSRFDRIVTLLEKEEKTND